ncbi:MAG TPA: 3'(2'),5'-bisphosphate nucleotidase CysQ [Candidatus Saccharimonadales bacterium]|nr:3'(2'),5'-bisphosphate nucleotidase CysQ [Candidatus Saccharimonadales bacterium]
MSELLEQVIELAKEAGETILDIYAADELEIENKEDEGYVSPLTQADKASHEIIQSGLEKISEHPVISEEGNHKPDGADIFWLVDPLDGTKEFINRNGEFTVNIGLIKDGRPVLGVIYQPAGNVMYAAEGDRAFKILPDGRVAPLKPPVYEGDKPKIVVSRNHKGEKLGGILTKLGPHEEADVGSSLKFCLLAEGTAQAYPRLVPTYLWDTAAADAVLSATGGEIRDFSGRLLNYDPEKDIRNPFFIATARGCGDLYKKIKDISEEIE